MGDPAIGLKPAGWEGATERLDKEPTGRRTQQCSERTRSPVAFLQRSEGLTAIGLQAALVLPVTGRNSETDLKKMVRALAVPIVHRTVRAIARRHSIPPTGQVVAPRENRRPVAPC
jgi:hypothetical protein